MFKGSIVALITPMDQNGKICHINLKKLVNYHILNGTKAIVAVGTTGESSTLSYKEHIETVMKILEFSNGRIPIIAGTGSNSTKESISLNKEFEKSGVVACLSVIPYYNRPTQEGIYCHFKKIAEDTSLPQLLYNVPSRTGCNILPETVIRLSIIPNIIGIKEASDDLARVNLIKMNTHKNFILLSGDDISALDFIQLGGQGIISVTANIAAFQMAKICSLAINKDFEKARILNQNLFDLHRSLFLESNPIPIKWAAKKLGLISHDTLRLPLTKINEKNKFVLYKSIKKAGLLYKEIQ